MKRKTYTIFDSYDTYSDERKKEAKENIIENAFFDTDDNGCITVTDNFGKEIKVTREEYEKSITDERVTDECCFLEEAMEL